MSLLSFWPPIEEINECIKNEAETAHEAILLAVHRPIPIQKRTVEGGNVIQSSEDELLDFFLTPDPPSGTVIMPITGPSGIGKSHIIRWIESQMRFRDTDNRYHIIRVPKSASLSHVVRLILEPLQGEQYEQLLQKLQKASAEITHEIAVIQFQAGLEIALINYANQLSNNPGNYAIRGHANNLPRLFNDAALKNHFSENVFKKLTKRALEGRELNKEETDILPQFEIDDLMLPNSIDINNAAFSVRQYYLTQLATKEQKIQAVNILNSVLDETIRIAFKLSGQLSDGMTLQDLVLKIRKMLLKEGKELVLLIEDFVALAGIQTVILEIAIKEAIHNGERQFCNMRTAIAVTDGLAGRDTILTRAQYEWIIQSQIEDPEELVVDLVGSYLNAARFGSQKIRDRYNEIRNKKVNNAVLTGWLNPFDIEDIDEDTRNILNAFGKSSKEHYLFPLNRKMICHLMRQYLRQGDRLIFNPRTVINRIIRDILKLRNYFERNEFPPSSISYEKGTAFVAKTITERVNREQRYRYECFLSLWGGNPNTQNELNTISPLLFKAFNLKNLSEGNIEAPPLQPLPAMQPPIPVETVYDTNRWKQFSERSKQWETMLQEWVEGIRMPQADANKIRQHLEMAVKNYINWNELCIDIQPVEAILFWIPNAHGNKTETIKIAQDNQDEDGTLRIALTALYRCEEAGYKWDYPGGDSDAVHYVEFVEKISQEVVNFLVNKTSSELIPIMQGLFVGSHVIGVSNEDSKDIDSVLIAITKKKPERIENLKCIGLHDSWDDLIKKIYDKWDEMQKEFFKRCACYQGDGKKEFAIDYPLLSMIFKAITFYGDIKTDGLKQDFRPVLQQLINNNIFRSKVKSVFERLNYIRKLVNTNLGQDFDKQATINSIRNVIDNTTILGLWPQRIKTSDEIKGLIREFEQSAIKDILDKITKLPLEFDEQQIHSYVPIFGQLDSKVLSTTKSFIEEIDKFLTKLEDEKVDFRLKELKQYNAKNAAKNVINQLEGLTKNLSTILGTE